jgi:predicted secreted protein
MDGKKILMKLKIGSTLKLLAGQISSTQDIKVDTWETTHKLSTGGAKTYQAGQHTISYKVDCIVDENDSTNAKYEDVYTAMLNKAEVDYTYGGIVAGETTYSGKGLITGLSQSAPSNDKVSFSLDLLVTGAETKGVAS